MASVFRRKSSRVWYAKLKDEQGEWFSKSTGYADEDKAQEYADEAQRVIDERREGGDGGPSRLTVRGYVARWAEEREALGVRSASKEEARLRNHALPTLGSMRMTDVQPRHIRDLVRALRKDGTLAPRSVRHVYTTLHTMFESAVVEEVIPANPCALTRRELPAVRDKDPEWRHQATYSVAEVERLITDSDIPPERRIIYALKALAGLRHEEVAPLRWRHYEPEIEPLGRLMIAVAWESNTRQETPTKTESPRRVPVHPELARLLAEWKLGGWPATYGRAPTGEDLIVPFPAAKSPRPIESRYYDNQRAARLFKSDLEALELRVDAGKQRARGGHDLRSWFITTCQEHGAHRDLLRVVSHGVGSDVMSGYTRASWGALCAEVAKLRIDPEPRGRVIPLGVALVESESTKRDQNGNPVEIWGVEPQTS